MSSKQISKFNEEISSISNIETIKRIENIESILDDFCLLKQNTEKITYAISWTETTFKVMKYIAGIITGIFLFYKEISPYINLNIRTE
jgi:hypothetical protein